MLLSDLQNKEVVSIIDGRRLGKICDIQLQDNGAIIYFVVEIRRFFGLFSGGSEVNVNFDQIHKIGEDVILVNL